MKQHMGPCGSCVFWKPQEPTSQQGHCHRYPAIPMIVGMMQIPGPAIAVAGQPAQPRVEPIIRGVLPPTVDTVECGEHIPKVVQ